jgi:hypothetical protein
MLGVNLLILGWGLISRLTAYESRIQHIAVWRTLQHEHP